MKIEIRNFKHSDFASKETICFSAVVYIDGVRAGTAENEGHGGPTNVDAYYNPHTGKLEGSELIAKAMAYCKSLPKKKGFEGTPDEFEYDQTLDSYIDDLVHEELKKKDAAKMAKKMLKKVMWGVPGGHSYTEASLGGKDRTIASMLADPREKEALRKWLKGWKATFKPGEVFFNTNLPADILPQ